MFCVYSEIMAQDDSSTFEKNQAVQLLPMSKVDQSH